MSSTLQVGPLAVTVHRTVRVPEGRVPSQLPPSLGTMDLRSVSKYRDKCPESWEDDAVFVLVHDVEAMWLSFRPKQGPYAVICGAGGVNALTGEKLDLVPAVGNYMVCPPQPWLDGWKDQDGTVYQFVSTPYKKGEGQTVAEQLIGEESKSGGIGIAVFEPADRNKLKQFGSVKGGWMPGQYDDPSSLKYAKSLDASVCCLSAEEPTSGTVVFHRKAVYEMGVGKGGKIHQKIYDDPHGVDVWKSEPIAVKAIYLVDAVAFEEITGETAPPSPVSSGHYSGPWFGLQDADLADVQGSGKFTGLASVFNQKEPADAGKKQTG